METKEFKELLKELFNSKGDEFTPDEVCNMLYAELEKPDNEIDGGFVDICLDALSQNIIDQKEKILLPLESKDELRRKIYTKDTRR